MHTPFHAAAFQQIGRRLGQMFLSFIVIATLFFLLFGSETRPSSAQEQKQATIIVQFDDQAHLLRRVAFTQPISGLMALAWSGLKVITTSTDFGPAVCSIEGIGCPADDCFCDSTHYWGYSYWDGNAWQGYPVGAVSSVISRTGAVEGWRWGEFGATQIPATRPLAAAAAQEWLQARQSITNGGYGGASPAIETMLAIGANRLPAAAWRRSITSPSLANFVELTGATYARNSVGATGKLALAIAATDACLPVSALTPQAYYSPTLGTYSKQSGPNSLAILGAVAISETVPTAAQSYLQQAQQPNGGWEWAPGWGADTNATALAVQALVANGTSISSTALISALAFLADAQNTDGGFAYDLTPTSPSDANSTAYVVQALLAAGEDPTSSRWTVSNTHPISYLLALQLPDGSFAWQPGLGSNALATQQVLPALWGRAHPVTQQMIERCPATYLPLIANR